MQNKRMEPKVSNLIGDGKIDEESTNRTEGLPEGVQRYAER